MSVSDLKTFSPYEEQKEPTKAASIVGAPIKGFLQEGGTEVRKIGRLIGNILGIPEEELGMVSEEEAETKLEELFPTQQGSIEGALERGGKILPYALLGGGGALQNVLRTLFGGIGGQAVEELGGGPLAQGIAEIGSFSAPDIFKKFLGGKGVSNLIEEARQLGLTESEIAPLIQGEKKQKFLSKLAERRGRSTQALTQTKGALDNVYSSLASSGEAKLSLGTDKSKPILQKINRKFLDLPSEVQDLIQKDYQKFLDNPVTGDSLIRFYSNINSKYGKEGGKRLGILKEPIQEGLAKISPSLSKNFNLTNKLFSKYFEIASRLKPNLATDFLSASEAARIGYGAVTGNYPVLLEALGESAARSLATELLINPRLQNLSRKTVSALNQNKPAIAERLFRQMGEVLKKKHPETALELQKIDLSTLTNVEEEK